MCRGAGHVRSAVWYWVARGYGWMSGMRETRLVAVGMQV